jgi:histidine ammonia-lyase
VVAETMAALLNAGITPAVHEYGSLGCSGDLAPLAACALVLMGEGTCSATTASRRGRPGARRPRHRAGRPGRRRAWPSSTHRRHARHAVMALADLEQLADAADVARR